MKCGEAKCGTPSGYTRHKRNSEKPCDACAAAESARFKRYMEAPEHARLARLRSRAQGKAYAALHREFPEQYRAYYEAALAELTAEQSEEAQS